MPGKMKPGKKNVGPNIKEFESGGRYKKAVAKYGVKHAKKIAQAAGLHAAFDAPAVK